MKIFDAQRFINLDNRFSFFVTIKYSIITFINYYFSFILKLLPKMSKVKI